MTDYDDDIPDDLDDITMASHRFARGLFVGLVVAAILWILIYAAVRAVTTRPAIDSGTRTTFRTTQPPRLPAFS